ncbi:MAG: VCBS repeat-containing protein [Acidobacteria bacterium]|nr:VCBS repeat-containing protein [Acidobacteriota bacterium]MBI3656478.1 VCBS repeat-containing protein [Acidobacteriota bacterium]
MFSPASVGDLDGDGVNEVIATLGGGLGGALALYAWHADGRGVVSVADQPNGFFAPIPDSAAWFTPALADLYGEGKLKIILGTQSGVHIFNADATSTIIEPGIPFRLRPVVVDDLDGDGSLEIIAVSDPCPVSCEDPAWRLHVWDNYGNPLPGWPQRMPMAWSAISALAVGDLDGDGKKEIVLAIEDGRTLAPPHILAYNLDGTIKWSTPIEMDDFCRLADVGLALSLADVDNDGNLEVVFQRNGRCSRTDHRFGILDGQGRLKNEWFLSRTENWFPSLLDVPLGDLDGDNHLEIITSTTTQGTPIGRIFAWHHTGDLVEGFPVAVDQRTLTPMVADVDGDGSPDIVSSLGLLRDYIRNPIYACDPSGRLIDGWPKWLPRVSYPPGWVSAASYTTLADVNGDEILDLIASVGGGELHVITLGSRLNPGSMHWPTVRHDFRHTGRYSSEK